MFRGLVNVFWTLAFPLLFIVLFGFLYGDLVWFEDGVRAIDYILPGILVMAIMVTGMMQTAIGFAEERKRGIYRRLSITPLKPSAILGGQILHRYVLVLLQTLIIFAVGDACFWSSHCRKCLLDLGNHNFRSAVLSCTGFLPRGAYQECKSCKCNHYGRILHVSVSGRYLLSR